MNRSQIVDVLIRRVGELPPMPDVAQKAIALIRDPDSDMAELAKILVLDQALTSKVLHWANSAYYGLVNPVSTVQQAITYLGHHTLQSLILAASVTTYMERPVPGYALDRGELWKHSIGMAAGVRLVARKFGPQVAEEAYHAGLLCDIGKLAFEILLRNVDTSGQEWQNRPFSELEIIHFGIDHATLGAEMARQWMLPPPLVDAIANHHHPSQASEGAILADAVHIADAVMMSLGSGIGCDGLQYFLDPASCERMGWTEKKYVELLEQVVPLIAEADAFLRN